MQKEVNIGSGLVTKIMMLIGKMTDMNYKIPSIPLEREYGLIISIWNRFLNRLSVGQQSRLLIRDFVITLRAIYTTQLLDYVNLRVLTTCCLL